MNKLPNCLLPISRRVLLTVALLVVAATTNEALAQTGACCEPGNTCSEGSAAACTTGVYQGDGSECATHCPEPTGTQFTFQGAVAAGNGAPLGGTIDLSASLWTAAVGGSQVGSTQIISEVGLSQGLFTVQLDFGAEVFDGDARWLEIGVRHPAGGAGGFTIISPRQPIRTTPYAIQTRGIFVDNAFRVGVGTTNPQFRLDVRSTAPRAIFGWVTNPTGDTHGVFGQSASTQGKGVTGYASADSGDTLGVYGLSESPTGRGVYGLATSSTGRNYGVFGETNSKAGFAGYFAGRGEFSEDLGVGTIPGARLHVSRATTDTRPTLLVDTQQDLGRGLLDIVSLQFAENAIDAYSFSAGPLSLRLNPNSSGDVLLALGGGRVGINTAAPASELHVVGTGNLSPAGGGIVVFEHGPSGNQLAFDGNEMQARNGGSPGTLHLNASGGDVAIVQSGGRVGIGTASPNHELVIQGDDPAMQIRDDTTDNSANAARFELLERAGGDFDGGAFFWWNGATNKLLVGTKVNGVNTNVLVVDRATSSVGIGTQNPGNYRLAVNGPIRAKEIVVETGWSDFVFEPDYNLRPLEEVEAYIGEHGHLPDTPSAEEVARHGVKVGEMESKLLQKVEELTLHLIEMNDRVKALEQENVRLKSRLDLQPVAEGSVK